MTSSIRLIVVLAAAAAGMPLVLGQNMGWADSYSEGGRCYCQTTFDHNIGGVIIPGTGGLNARVACAKAGQGPNTGPRAFYNDIQCGNGPPNDAGDEGPCPGRVDLGNGNRSGCNEKGPKFDFTDSDPGDHPVALGAFKLALIVRLILSSTIARH